MTRPEREMIVSLTMESWCCQILRLLSMMGEKRGEGTFRGLL